MAILSNKCVKHAPSHAYTSAKPPTVNGEKDAWHGAEVPAVLSELFVLTLSSKSLQINVNPLWKLTPLWTPETHVLELVALILFIQQ